MRVLPVGDDRTFSDFIKLTARGTKVEKVFLIISTTTISYKNIKKPVLINVHPYYTHPYASIILKWTTYDSKRSGPFISIEKIGFA